MVKNLSCVSCAAWNVFAIHYYYATVLGSTLFAWFIGTTLNPKVNLARVWGLTVPLGPYLNAGSDLSVARPYLAMSRGFTTRVLKAMFVCCSELSRTNDSTGQGRRNWGAGALCVEMGFYADISWKSRCNIEINVWAHFYKILLVFEVPYWPRVKKMPGKS